MDALRFTKALGFAGQLPTILPLPEGEGWVPMTIGGVCWSLL